MQVVNGILRLVGQTRPLLFFSGAGVMTLGSGVGLGGHIIQTYARTQTLAIGYGLVTVILCVIGMLLVFAGIILHSVRGMLVEIRSSVFERSAGHTLSDNVVVLQEHREELGLGKALEGA
jgi:hypothetical protein